MQILALPSTILPIKKQMKHVPSGLEMFSHMELSESTSTIFLSDYNYIKIKYNISQTEQSIKLYFDNEII
jgi:hypothetical protein